MIMYSVKEVSDMYCVDEETVRRWIRDKKLKATKKSKKDGYTITDSALREFGRRKPKYNKIDVVNANVDDDILAKATELAVKYPKLIEELYLAITCK